MRVSRYMVFYFCTWTSIYFLIKTAKYKGQPAILLEQRGRVVVRHKRDENLFYLAESSSRYFYLTVYSYWEFDLEEVTLGWRLAIVIGLELVKTPLVVPPPN